MGKSGKSLIISVVAVVLFAAAVSVTAFALLIHETKVDSEVVFGEIEPGATDFVLSHDADLNFKSAGDKFSVEMSVLNNSKNHFDYYYEITADNSNGLENAILVEKNGKFISTLQAANAPVVLDGGMIFGKTESRTDRITDKIDFELHNGAKGSFADLKNCRINIKLMTKTIDYGENIVVSDASELKLAVDDVNNGGKLKTIRISNDVALNADLTITKGVNIDFAAGILIFGGFTLTFNGAKLGAFGNSGAVRFMSSRGAYTDTINNSKSIIINSLQIYADIDDDCSGLSRLLSLYNYDRAAAKNAIAARIGEKLKNGAAAKSETDLYGGLSIYKSDIVTSAADSSANLCSVENGVLNTKSTERTAIAELTIDKDITVKFKVLGASESGYSEIIADAFKHLYAVTADTGAEINADLYLPVSIPKYNMSIAWSSDRADVMDAGGRISADGEGTVALTAVITINDDVIIRNIEFNVYKQNNQMRFDYLVARIGEKKLSALYTADSAEGDGSYFVLPVVSVGRADDYREMYGMRNIGLASLYYQLDVNADYLSLLGGNTVALIEPTFETSQDITIRAVFKNEPKKIYEAVIHVVIEPVDNVKLHNKIIDYVQGLLNNIDVLENILSTRAELGMASEKGDFVLPGKYKIFTLGYSRSDGAGDAGDAVIRDIKPTDSGDYIIGVDAAKFASSEKRVKFYLTVEMSGKADGEALKTVSPVYVGTPAALNFFEESPKTAALGKGAPSVNDSDLFYSLKLQTISALKGGAGAPDVSDVFGGALRAALEPNYILKRDLEFLRSLAVVCDSATAYSSDSQSIPSVNGMPYLGLKDGAFTDAGGTLREYLYGVIGEAVNIESLYLKASAGADSIYPPDSALSVLEFAVGKFSRLTALTVKDSHIADASVIRQIGGLKNLDISGNLLSDFDWLTKTSGGIINLDLRRTGFTENKLGILDALYYRAKRRDPSVQPKFLYTASDGSDSEYVPSGDAELKLSHLLYSLSEIDSVKVKYLQLKANVFDGADSYQITWSLPDADVSSGTVTADDGVSVAGFAAEPLRLENLLSAADKSEISKYYTVRLLASVTDGTITAEREFAVKIFYITDDSTANK